MSVSCLLHAIGQSGVSFVDVQWYRSSAGSFFFVKRHAVCVEVNEHVSSLLSKDSEEKNTSIAHTWGTQ